MVSPRRLSANTRKAAQKILTDPTYVPATVWLICRDALYDLDVADGERDELAAQLECMRLKKEVAENSANGAAKRIVELHAKYEAAEKHFITLSGSNNFALNTVEKLRMDLTAAQTTIIQLQEKCEKIPGLMAQAEAHRTLLMERDAQIAAMLPMAKFGMEASNNPPIDLGNLAQLAAAHDAAVRADERAKVLEQIEKIVWKLHEPGCPSIADDESDAVLADFQECACITGKIRDAIRALAAQPEEELSHD